MVIKVDKHFPPGNLGPYSKCVWKRILEILLLHLIKIECQNMRMCILFRLKPFYSTHQKHTNSDNDAVDENYVYKHDTV